MCASYSLSPQYTVLLDRSYNIFKYKELEFDRIKYKLKVNTPHRYLPKEILYKILKLWSTNYTEQTLSFTKYRIDNCFIEDIYYNNYTDYTDYTDYLTIQINEQFPKICKCGGFKCKKCLNKLMFDIE